MTMENTNGNQSVTAQQIRSYVQRIERLEEEKKVIAADIRDIYTEAKFQGFDAKILRKCIALRKKTPEERQEEEAVLDLYLHALGMVAEPVDPEEDPLPLEETIRREEGPIGNGMMPAVGGSLDG